MDKAAKKALKNQYKQNAVNQFLSSLPMSVNLFRSLFDFLDNQINKDAGSDFSYTKQFCITHGTNYEVLKNWLIENGAANDNEVLWNIEEKFGEG